MASRGDQLRVLVPDCEQFEPPRQHDWMREPKFRRWRECNCASSCFTPTGRQLSPVAELAASWSV